jgi:hypothetical protein
MNKSIASLLMFLALTVMLSACSGPVCDSGHEEIPDNAITGRQGGVGTEATLCVDKAEYKTGDTVHMTFTVKNAYHEPLVLDGGQQPVMDICPAQHQCLSQYQPDVAQLTHLVLEPGQSHTIQWDWPTSDVDLQQAVHSTCDVTVNAYWVGARPPTGIVFVQFCYGPRRGLP